MVLFVNDIFGVLILALAFTRIAMSVPVAGNSNNNKDAIT